MIDLKDGDTLFSVIVPTLGRDELLLGCVASIMAGKYQNFEILIIDQDPNQCLRNSLSQRYPSEDRIRYLFLEQTGASKARNHGLLKAKGKYVAFIDDDAVAVREWLQSFYNTFQSVDLPDLIAGRIDPLWTRERPMWYPQECEYILGVYNIGDKVCSMPEQDQPISANLAGLRQVILELGGFNEELGPNYFRKYPQITGEDSFLGLMARQSGYKIYYDPHALVDHRISINKLTKMNFLRRYFWEGVTVILEMEFLGKLGSRYNHFIYHSKYVVKKILLSIFPGLSRQADGRHLSPSMRMLHLSQVFYSLGTLYSVINLDNIKKR